MFLLPRVRAARHVRSRGTYPRIRIPIAACHLSGTEYVSAEILILLSPLVESIADLGRQIRRSPDRRMMANSRGPRPAARRIVIGVPVHLSVPRR